MQKLFFNFELALEGVAANRLRAFLTALGIVFGVAAVIAMLAIGTGKNTKDWSPGLTLGDVRAITSILPGVSAVSPEIVLPTTIIRDGKIGKSRAVGVSNAFFELNNLGLDRGTMFHDIHQERGDPVCIIGQEILRKYFSAGNPIGQRIKCGNTWLRIIGVLEQRIAKDEQLENLGIRDYNQDVYVPLQTALIRFKDRSYAHLTNIGRSRRNQKACSPSLPVYPCL